MFNFNFPRGFDLLMSILLALIIIFAAIGFYETVAFVYKHIEVIIK